MNWWWLSFVDGARPEGDRFLGVAIVGPVAHMGDAVRVAHLLGCNPGGAVKGVEIPDDMLAYIPESFRERVLIKEQCAELDRIIAKGKGRC